MDARPKNAVLFATMVVVNIIWWMLMITAIGLGITHLYSCPVQPYIPIYLIVLGGSSLISLTVAYNYCRSTDGLLYFLGSVCMAILHLFNFIWLIAGACWVYSIYLPNYSEQQLYCDKTTYHFAFVITTLLWVMISLLIVCGCCFGAFVCCKTVSSGRNLLPHQHSFYGAVSHHQGLATGDV